MNAELNSRNIESEPPVSDLDETGVKWRRGFVPAGRIKGMRRHDRRPKKQTDRSLAVV
jgi:hypothetical protein